MRGTPPLAIVFVAGALLADPGSVVALGRALSDTDRLVQERAALARGVIGSDAAAARLLPALWSLHFPGFPTGPSHDSVALHGIFSLQGLAPRAGCWRSSEQHFSWHEHAWYSILSIPANERAVQTRAMDHFVTSIVATVRDGYDSKMGSRISNGQGAVVESPPQP